MHFEGSSLLNNFPAQQTNLNITGRDRCRDGILQKSPQTIQITPEMIPSLDFIMIEDFLNKAETDTLLSAFEGLKSKINEKNLNNTYWQGRLLFAHEVNTHSPQAGQIMARFQKEATKKLEIFYKLTQPIYADTVQLVYWREGMHMPAHADNANPDGTPHGMPWRNFSSIVYLNDEYEGGELYFTALDKYIKPKSGTLVAFTGGFHHEHAVLKVLKGERFTMPAFYTFDAQKADHFIYPELFRPKT